MQSSNLEKAKYVRFITIMVILAILLILALMISMNTGLIRLSPLDVVRTLLGAGTEKQELILFHFRLPRIVLSILIGAGLAVSGVILQGISRNALADPGILGINAGAGLAVIIFISFYSSMEAAPVLIMPFFALIGAGISALLIYSLAFKRGQGISPTRLILVGIAIAAGINAAILVLTIRLDPRTFQLAEVWLAGSIWGTNWLFVLAIIPWLVILLPYAMYKARVLNILSLNEQTAIGLGMPIERERFRLILTAVALAGACVAVGGGIGFVGLIAPHLTRRLVGPKHQLLIPASALIGGLLLIVADTLARSIIEPSEIPVGIVVSVIGAPYFLYLLAKTKA